MNQIQQLSTLNLYCN